MADAAHSNDRIYTAILPGSCLMQQLEASGALTDMHGDLPSTSGCIRSSVLRAPKQTAHSRCSDSWPVGAGANHHEPSALCTLKRLRASQGKLAATCCCDHPYDCMEGAAALPVLGLQNAQLFMREPRNCLVSTSHQSPSASIASASCLLLAILVDLEKQMHRTNRRLMRS